MRAALTKSRFIPVCIALVLGSCASQPDFSTPCPPISLREGFEQLARTGTQHGQLVHIRLTGVETSCIAAGGGFTRMEVVLGLQVSRAEDSDLRFAENAAFAATFVFVDRSDIVVERKVFSNVVTLEIGDAATPANAGAVLDIPADTRVVFALGKRATGL